MYNDDDDDVREPENNELRLVNLVKKDSKFFHLFNFFDKNFNDDAEAFFKRSGDIFNWFPESKNAKIKSLTRFGKHGLPAIFFLTELGLKVKNYVKTIKEQRLDEHDRYTHIVRKKLEIPDPEVDQYGKMKDNAIDYLENFYPSMGKEILLWLFSNPKLAKFRIQNVYKYASNELQKIDVNLSKIEVKQDYYIHVQYKDIDWLYRIKFYNQYKTLLVDEAYLYYDIRKIPNDEVFDNFESDLITEYINSFDIGKNILVLDSTIKKEERRKIPTPINQFDVNQCIKEIRNVLNSGKRRGIAFIGKQGTGKTLIVRKIEETITEFIVLRLLPGCLSNSTQIGLTFAIIKNVEPAIVVLEDFDSFNLKKKNATFLAGLDSLENTVVIATLNDTTKVHRTIIDRPQRFDEIIEIKTPQSDKEFYDVMETKYRALGTTKFPTFPDITDIDPTIFTKCTENAFTQAAMTSIIDKVLILYADYDEVDLECFNKLLLVAVLTQEKSRKLLIKYTFDESVNGTHRGSSLEEFINSAENPDAPAPPEEWDED